MNPADASQNLVNNYNLRDKTNNVETGFAVDSGAGYMAIVDVNDGFYYPNSNPAITSSQLSNGINLKYDTIKVHVRSGYNFQDSEGFFTNAFVRNTSGDRISLLSQAAFKGDLSQFKYNNTPIRISETTFDKYVEYKILSVAEILSGGNQTAAYFNANFLNISSSPIIFVDFGFISQVDGSEGFVKFWNASDDIVSIPAYDGFSRLQPHLIEKASYFEYSALWDGNSIENFITILNSKAGNAYHIEHEIAVYEQRGYDFYEMQRHNSVQKFNYDIPLKFRPIISNLVDGSLQIEYIMKFFNAADNTSIVKRAMLNTSNTAPYLEEPMRISVPIENNIKVYNKVIRKDISIDNKKSVLDTKIIIPIYYSNIAVKIDDEDFLLELVPFDNIYSIYLNKEINGQDSPLVLDMSVQYQLVFITKSGEKIRVIENDITGKRNGILNFKIGKEQSQIILRDSFGKFFINTISDIIETNVCVGEWIEKGKKNKAILDSMISERDIVLGESIKVLESVSADVPVITVPITNDNIEALSVNNGVIITKNDTQDFDVQDINQSTLTDSIKNPVVGDVKSLNVIPDGTRLPLKIFMNSMDFGFINTLNDKKKPVDKTSIEYLMGILKLKNKR